MHIIFYFILFHWVIYDPFYSNRTNIVVHLLFSYKIRICYSYVYILGCPKSFFRFTKKQ